MPARIGKALASKPMMHGHDQSDSPVRAKKSANNAERSAAESMEQRGGPKGKTVEPATRRAQNRESVSPGLDRLRQFVRNNRKARVTTLLHHVDVALLRWSYLSLKRNAAAGVDGRTWQAYGENLEERLVDLHARVHRGAYRALPSRRRMIPKPDGFERPLGIASIEDKIVQRAMVEVLNVIYEKEFVGFYDLTNAGRRLYSTYRRWGFSGEEHGCCFAQFRVSRIVAVDASPACPPAFRPDPGGLRAHAYDPCMASVT